MNDTADDETRGGLWAWGFAIAIGLVMIVALGGVIQHYALPYGDEPQLNTNPSVRDGLSIHSVMWSFAAHPQGNWHPVTWWTYLLDHSLAGNSPGWAHGVSLLVHIACTIMLFVLLYSTTGSLAPSMLATVIFGLHPLMVEPVAWIIQRKYLLGTFLGLSSLYAYSQAIRTERGWLTWLAVALGLLAMMSAPGMFVFPLLLLLWEYWPLQRFDGPFEASDQSTEGNRWPAMTAPKVALAAAAVLAALLVWYYAAEVRQALPGIPIGTRLGRIVVGYGWYLMKFIWPYPLLVEYRSVASGLALWQVLVSLALVSGISLAIALWGRERRYLMTGWLWYLVAVTPFVGILRASPDVVADRFAYMPMVGLAIATAWLLRDLLAMTPFPTASMAGIGSVLCIVWCLVDMRQVPVWKDSGAVWSHVIDYEPQNGHAHFEVGTYGIATQAYDDALTHFDEAVRIDPDDLNARFYLGYIYRKLDRFEDASREFEQMVKTDPDFALGHYGLAQVLKKSDKADEAFRELKLAISLAKEDSVQIAAAHSDLGEAYEMRGERMAAIQEYRAALRCDPTTSGARLRLAAIAQAQGRDDEVLQHLRDLVKARPDDPQSYLALANQLQNRGSTSEAVENYRKALKIEPNFRSAANNLAWILATSLDDKLRSGKESLALAQVASSGEDATNPARLDTLAAAMAEIGAFDDAVETGERAMDQAIGANNPSLAADILLRVNGYREKKPYRAPPPSPKAVDTPAEVSEGGSPTP